MAPRTPDTSSFSRVGKETIIRDPSNPNAITADEIAYTAWVSVGDKLTILATSLIGSGTGDMSKIIYDTNNNGRVDDSDKLEWETKADLRIRSSHTWTQSADTITDGITNVTHLATERAKLATIETSADVTDYDNVNSVLNATSVKWTNWWAWDYLNLLVWGTAMRFSLEKLANTLWSTLVSAMGLIWVNIGNTPSGNVSATTVQWAINELDSEKTSASDVNGILSAWGYYKSGGTDVSVSDGGTGTSSFNANGVILGWSTTTAPLTSLAPPTSNRMVLTWNFSGAPSFQDYKRGTIYTSTVEISASGYAWVWYPILSITIPAWAIWTGKWLSISWTYITHPFGLTDYKDDSVIRVSLWWTMMCQNTIWPRATNAADFYGNFDMIISWTSTTSQKNVMSSFTRGWPNATYGRNDITRNDTSVNTTWDLTLDIYFWFEFSNASCYSKLQSIIIKEI